MRRRTDAEVAREQAVRFGQCLRRVIALENLVIALLAEAPERQLALARGMATCISPRTVFTLHPVTLRAADEMLSLVDRAGRYPRRLLP